MQWPDFCHALARPEKLTNPADNSTQPLLKRHYEGRLTFKKFDVVCFGEDIAIDRPIRTGGGDLVIYAKSLTLSAPIDSRIYRELDVATSFLDPTQGMPFPEGPSAFNYYNVLSLISSGGWTNDGLMRSAYVEYYGCRDQCIEVGAKRYTYRTPDGLTLPMLNMPLAGSFAADIGASKHDGVAPPIELIDFNGYKSGNIYLYVQQLHVGKDSKGPLIITSGAPGGVGGAGEPYNCVGIRHQSGEWSCLDWTSSTLNAPGGRGGDAGSITLSLLETQGAKLKGEQIALFHSISSFEGGAPGPSDKLRAPTYAGNPLSFHLFEHEGVWPTSQPGSNGEAHVLTLDATELFSRFYDVVKSKDAFPVYDYQELANRILRDQSKDDLTFDDYITKSLVRRIIRRYEAVVSDAKRLFINAATVQRDLEREQICINAAQTRNFSEQASNALLKLHDICNWRGSPFRAFLEGSGGLLNIVDENADKNFLQAASSYTSFEDKELWHRMLSVLMVSQAIQMKAFASQERARYDDKLNKLRGQISTLEQSIAAIGIKNAQNPNYLAMAGTLIKAYSSVSGFMDVTTGIYATAQSDTDISSDQLNKLTKSAGEMSKAFSEVSALSPTASTVGIVGAQSQIFAIKKNISALQMAQSEVLVDMAFRSKEALQDASAELATAIDKRAQYGRKVRGRILFFSDLIRLSVISFYLDPSRSVSALGANINGLQTFLSGFPEQDPNFLIRRFSGSCEANYLGKRCMEIAPHRNWTVVQAKLQSPAREKIILSLYVLAPNSNTIRLQVLDFKTTQILKK
ncbi:hypothetical protein ACTUVN_002358 [Pseudomonas caspiana]